MPRTRRFVDENADTAPALSPKDEAILQKMQEQAGQGDANESQDAPPQPVGDGEPTEEGEGEQRPPQESEDVADEDEPDEAEGDKRRRPRRRPRPQEPMVDDTDPQSLAAKAVAFYKSLAGQERPAKPETGYAFSEGVTTDMADTNLIETGYVDFDQLLGDINVAAEEATIKAVSPLAIIIDAQNERLNRLTELLNEKLDEDAETRETLGKAVTFMTSLSDTLQKGIVSVPAPVTPEAAPQETTPTEKVEVLEKGVLPAPGDEADATTERLNKAVTSVRALLSQGIVIPNGYGITSAVSGGRPISTELLSLVEKEIVKATTK